MGGEVRGEEGKEGKEGRKEEGKERRSERGNEGVRGEEGERGRCYLLTATVQPYSGYPAYSKWLYYILTFVPSICSCHWIQTIESCCADTLLHL